MANDTFYAITKSIWLDYGIDFSMVLILIFGVVWISQVIYVYACKELKEYKKQLKKFGTIKNVGYTTERMFLDPFIIFYYFEKIPDENKYPAYYEFEEFRRVVKKVKNFRQFYKKVYLIYFFILFPLMIFMLSQFGIKN